MGLRETLNENPGITTAATAIIIVAAILFIVVSMFSGGSDAVAGDGNQEYYSDDDGKSFFIDDRNRIPPFDHNGKTAVRARLFTCDGGKTKFVGWLERYSAEGKKRLEELAKERGGDAPGMLLEDQTGLGLEFKKPGTGEKGWVKNTDPQVAQITDVKCPDGTVNNLEAVPPP